MGTSSQRNERQTEEFLKLYLNCEAQLHGYLLALLRNRADAEEAFQETVMVLWRRFDEFEPGTHFFAWAKGIAFHKALHRHQQRKRYTTKDNSFLEVVSAALDSEPEAIRLRAQILEQCLEKLGTADRELLDVRYGTTKKVKDYAKELEQPVNKVFKSLGRIRRILTKCVEQNLAMEAQQ